MAWASHRTKRVLRGLYASPEFVEFNAVVERDRVLYPVVAHFQKPRIGIVIRLTVARRAIGFEVDDDGVAVGVNVVDSRHEMAAHARVEWVDHLAHERLAIRIRL